MKIEKLNEDKIRITLNLEDLKEKDIDFHSFMSNSIESQELFLDMLDKAEEEVGFVTDDYKIMIEAIALSNGSFVLTVTRIIPDKEKEAKKRGSKVHIKRKCPTLDKQKAIYSFSSFDDFCEFCHTLNKDIIDNIPSFISTSILYFYNDKYYLVLQKVSMDFNYLKSFASSISEFGHFVNSSELFERKLQEYGKIIMKKNDITTCKKYFC